MVKLTCELLTVLMASLLMAAAPGLNRVTCLRDAFSKNANLELASCLNQVKSFIPSTNSWLSADERVEIQKSQLLQCASVCLCMLLRECVPELCNNGAPSFR